MGGGRGSSTTVQLAIPVVPGVPRFPGDPGVPRFPGDPGVPGDPVGPGAIIAAALAGTAAQIMSSRKPLNVPLTPDRNSSWDNEVS